MKPSDLIPERTEIAVRSKHLSVAFGPRIALDDLSLSFVAGALTVVMGPGSSGKSTLLRMVASQDISADLRRVGELEVNAESSVYLPQKTEMTDGVSPIRRRLAYRVDSSSRCRRALHDWFRREPDAEAVFDFSIDDSDLVPSLLRLAHLLLVISSEDPLVLLDEPTADFSEPRRHLAVSWIENYRRGRTFLVVSHHLGFAQALADYVVLLIDGVVFETGKAQHFFLEPKHPRTKQFLTFGS